ncbi:hypothetical protein [Bacillus cereus]|nr:hypothetical protein [Bacillus cereus]
MGKEARIAFLEAELTFLKKLDELERQALQINVKRPPITGGLFF